jgi:diguanylate cyclase (GGDEF)-like protein
MRRILNFLERQPPDVTICTSVILLVIIGYFDYITGVEFSFSIFYLLPIMLVTWLIGKKAGIIMAVCCSVTWLSADYFATVAYSHPLVPYWNTIVMLGIFLIFTYITAEFREMLDREKKMSRTDILTAAANRRHFFELAEMEIKRSSRYRRPFTVAYIDLDDFKYVNDHFGHSVGDELLRCVSNTISQNVRVTDVFARLGGDEFVVMLPESDDHAAIRNLVNKLQEKLLFAMKEKQWPITFSIGVIIFVKPPATVDEMINLPDELMYSIKRSGKNMVRFEVFSK